MESIKTILLARLIKCNLSVVIFDSEMKTPDLVVLSGDGLIMFSMDMHWILVPAARLAIATFTLD